MENLNFSELNKIISGVQFVKPTVQTVQSFETI